MTNEVIFGCLKLAKLVDFYMAISLEKANILKDEKR